MEPNARATYQQKVLSTIAHILHQQEEARSMGSAWNDSGSKTTPSPKARARAPVLPSHQFSPTKFNIPKTGWDLTPKDPLPLDWYITDQMVATRSVGGTCFMITSPRLIASSVLPTVTWQEPTVSGIQESRPCGNQERMKLIVTCRWSKPLTLMTCCLLDKQL